MVRLDEPEGVVKILLRFVAMKVCFVAGTKFITLPLSI